MFGPRSKRHQVAFSALLLAALGQAGIRALADEPKASKPAARISSPAILTSAEGLESIGGRWYVRQGQPPTYVYRDGDIHVDLYLSPVRLE